MTYMLTIVEHRHERLCGIGDEETTIPTPLPEADAHALAAKLLDLRKLPENPDKWWKSVTGGRRYVRLTPVLAA